MNLDKMLHKCRRDQWSVEDLDWSRSPRPMKPAEEMTFVQAFTDMAGIERLAGALFAVQRDRVDDPALAEIYDTFVQDEERHAQVAERLARHFDVHGYRRYHINPHLTRFAPRLVETARAFSPEVANIYITTGELLLDIALLRALDDACGDETCSDAMARINRDESRHVAIDFYMLERYARMAAGEPLRMPRLSGLLGFARMMPLGRPFIRDILVEPLDRLDPGGRRMREAFKRMQLAVRRPGVAERPFPRMLRAAQWLVGQPVVGAAMQPMMTALFGVDGRAFERLYTEAELSRVQRARSHRARHAA